LRKRRAKKGVKELKEKSKFEGDACGSVGGTRGTELLERIQLVVEGPDARGGEGKPGGGGAVLDEDGAVGDAR